MMFLSIHYGKFMLCICVCILYTVLHYILLNIKVLKPQWYTLCFYTSTFT